MRNKLLIALLLILGTIILSLFYSNLTRGRLGSAPLSPVSRMSGSQISSTPENVQIRFEAVIVRRLGGACIELFTPDEFEKYDVDPKWAIAATPRLGLALSDSVPGQRRGAVTGSYRFVKDVRNGPCNVVTGSIFEIDEIEYF